MRERTIEHRLAKTMKEYKVEEVQGYQKQDRGMQFLIHWKEYENKHD